MQIKNKLEKLTRN